MKVLYFHQHFSTLHGCIGTRSYEMARRLLADGHQVTMVCGSHGGGVTGLNDPFERGMRRGTVDGIDVIELDLAYADRDGLLRRSLQFVRFALRSVAIALREPCDVVFATTTPLTAGIPGIFARWLRRKPFVFEVRDLWPELPRAMGVIRNPLVLAALSLLEWASYRSANRLIGLSPGIVDGIVRRGVPRERVVMIPNGSDLDLFATPGERWRPAQIRDTDLVAVFTGAHGLANGLDAVLDAASELKRRGRDDIKLLLVGQGQLKPALQQRAACEGLDNVVFHEPVSKQRLSGLMASTDIGLQVLRDLPAFYFGTSPNKFFDYIATGIPVLNNYPGWIAEMVVANACGFAVRAGDPAAFADALEQAAADRDALKAMGRRSRQLAAREFDRAILSRRFVDWLQQAARRDRSTSAPRVDSGAADPLRRGEHGDR